MAAADASAASNNAHSPLIKHGKSFSVLLADDTQAAVGMRVVAIGSSESHRTGHTGVITKLHPVGPVVVRWGHSGESHFALRQKLMPEDECPTGLVSKDHPRGVFGSKGCCRVRGGCCLVGGGGNRCMTRRSGVPRIPRP